MNINYDFHIHSCLSPCGDNEMTPRNIVNLAKMLGIDAIALTDHNSCLNCPAVMQAGEEAGLIVVPGMELCTSEEVHIVCLFPALDNALSFSQYIEQHSFSVKNKPEVFGRQIIADKDDNELGDYGNLLITASAVSAANAPQIVASYGGICYPAHIDRGSYSIISNLGAITADMGFNAAEISDSGNEEMLFSRFAALKDMRIIRSSDAHNLEAMCRESHSLPVDAADIASIIGFFA